MRPRSPIAVVVGIFALVLAMVGAVATVASATVATDQTDYSPGSVVTISGDNTNGVGYVPGNTVNVLATADNGLWADSCTATVAEDGSWSCPVTLSSDLSIAVGSYTYTATSTAADGNTISETGTFTDGAFGVNAATLAIQGSDCSTGSSPFESGSDVCATVSVTGNGETSGSKPVYVVWYAPLSATATFTDSYSFNATGSQHTVHTASTAGTWTVKACSNSACDTLGSHVVYDTETFVVNAGPTKLAFTTTAQSGAVGDCLGAITVETQDGTGIARNVASATTVDLSTDAGTTGAGGFFSDSGCTTAITSQVISAGSDSTSFYYKATHRGTGSHEITAADHAGVLDSASQIESVSKASQDTLNVTGPTSGTYGQSYAIVTSGGSGTGALSYAVVAGSTACQIDPSDATKVKITSGTGTCSITATKAADADYNSATSIAAVVTVQKAAPTFTFDVSTLPAKTYGDSSFSVVSYASEPSDDTGAITFALGTGSVGCTVTSAGTVTITGAAVGTSHCVIAASLASDDNYSSAGPSSQQFNIAKAPLTVTADNRLITFGDSTPTFTVQYAGFVNGDDENDLGGTLTFTFTGTGGTSYGPSTTAPTHAGAYSITPGGLTSDNYAIAFHGGTLTIDKANQSITINTNAPSSAVYNSQFTVGATSSSGLTVTYSGAGGCTNSGATFTMTSGTTACTVYYDQAGNGDYYAAPQLSQTVTALKLATSVLYTGDTLLTIVSPGTTVAPTYRATLSPNPPCTGTVTYSVLDGDGHAVSDINHLPAGVYTVQADFAGNANCAASSDQATLTVGSPGSKATGGGFVSVPGIGRVNFGFIVDLVPKTTDQYKGQFVMVSPEKWRFKGTFGQAVNGTYVVTGTSGSGQGSGKVQYWNGTDWADAVGGNPVTFTISFTDNGSGTKKTTQADTFGVHVYYDAVGQGYDAATYGMFPNFPSTALKGGNITVSTR